MLEVYGVVQNGLIKRLLSQAPHSLASLRIMWQILSIDFKKKILSN